MPPSEQRDVLSERASGTVGCRGTPERLVRWELPATLTDRARASHLRQLEPIPGIADPGG